MGTGGHVYGIGRGPVVSTVHGGAIEIQRGAVLPSGNDAFAKLVFVNLRRNGRLPDFRKREAVAILYYKLSRISRRVGEFSREFHPVGCVLGIKRICIFDKEVCVEPRRTI
jgi:hypothetical protein